MRSKLGKNLGVLVTLGRVAYNNSYHASIGISPYKALYGRPCRILLYWAEVGERQWYRPELVQESMEKIRTARENMKIAQGRQKKYTDRGRRVLVFEVCDWVNLRVSAVKGKDALQSLASYPRDT